MLAFVKHTYSLLKKWIGVYLFFFSFFFIQVIAWTPKLCFLWFMPKIESNISAANLYLLLHGLWRSYVQYVIAGHVMFSALGQIAIIIVHIFNFFILAGARHLGSLRGKMFHCFLLHYSRCVLRLRHIYIFLSVNRECLNWVFELIGQSRSVINQLEWSRVVDSYAACLALAGFVCTGFAPSVSGGMEWKENIWRDSRAEE